MSATPYGAIRPTLEKNAPVTVERMENMSSTDAGCGVFLVDRGERTVHCLKTLSQRSDLCFLIEHPTAELIAADRLHIGERRNHQTFAAIREKSAAK